MGLKGQAKTDYQREYMRKRRAGQATAAKAKSDDGRVDTGSKAKSQALKKHASRAAHELPPKEELPRDWHRTREQMRIHQLEAKVRELEALVLPLDAEGKDAVRQHRRKLEREFRIRWKVYEESISRNNRIIIDTEAYATLLAGLHPDASEEFRKRARTVLERLKKHVVKWPPTT
jgi:hypothetical protein